MFILIKRISGTVLRGFFIITIEIMTKDKLKASCIATFTKLINLEFLLALQDLNEKSVFLRNLPEKYKRKIELLENGIFDFNQEELKGFRTRIPSNLHKEFDELTSLRGGRIASAEINYNRGKGILLEQGSSIFEQGSSIDKCSDLELLTQFKKESLIPYYKEMTYYEGSISQEQRADKMRAIADDLFERNQTPCNGTRRINITKNTLHLLFSPVESDEDIRSTAHKHFPYKTTTSFKLRETGELYYYADAIAVVIKRYFRDIYDKNSSELDKKFRFEDFESALDAYINRYSK
ncbi:MAG TPA: hypothetical protein DIV86_03265, partial [Alphaproteobacteria bacterium]|nr:hypothetical protein [Alphaproteobacteria bacterium]